MDFDGVEPDVGGHLRGPGVIGHDAIEVGCRRSPVEPHGQGVEMSARADRRDSVRRGVGDRSGMAESMSC
jgi:hypothetical protein